MSVNGEALSGKLSVGTQALVMAASSAIAQLILAGVYVVAARSATPASFGPIVAGIGLGMSAAAILDFGSNSLWVRELATSSMSRVDLGRRINTKLLISTILAVLWVVSSVVVTDLGSVWVAGPIAIAILCNQTFQVPVRAQGLGERAAVATLIDRAVVGLSLFFCLELDMNAAQSLWACIAFGSIASAVASLLMTPQKHRPIFRSLRPQNPWQKSRYYGISAAAVGAQSLDLPILSAVGGPVAAGLYGAVNRWTQPMGLLANAFASASVPFVARSRDWTQAWKDIGRSVWMLGVAILACLVVALLAPLIVEALVGSQYEGSATVLQLLAIGTIPAIVNQPLAIFLQSMGHDKIVSAITVSSVFVQLGLLAALSSAHGAAGAAGAFVLLQFMVLILLLVAFRAAIARTPSEVPHG
jgi:O-antigen/teichoic acid export membrane protein